jgi:hypothetical protein
MAKMNVWDTEDEYAAAAHAQASLPTPSDTPSRSPSHHSRRSSRKKSISPKPASSPGPMPVNESNSRRGSRDVSNDESISPLDPRRFTPTLHANLVAEILNLRRDQEEKLKTIESLETTLHASRNEVEDLTSSLSGVSKETRSLKRQLALLEGGTSSALGELAKERDEAVDGASETKRRLEQVQKKLRTQEEDVDRMHDLWARDKDNWDDERRKLERKVHVAEGRLKTVLEEIAAYESAQQMQADAEAEDVSRDIGHGSDTASVRSMSMASVRFSILSGANGYGSAKANGLTLADELDFTEEDETAPSETDGRESVLSIAHKRNQSRDSTRSRMHKHSQSIESLRRPGSVARGRMLANQSVIDKLEGRILEGDETPIVEKPVYVDTGIQFSPPPSPVLKPISQPEIAVIEKQVKRASGAYDGETEANQRRKRVHPTPPVVLEPLDTKQLMISAASQTIDDPLSPPRTPKSPVLAVINVEMISSSTQTDVELKPIPEAPQLPVPIPSISIHPPTSRPATPRESLLPQHFKDVGIQVSLQLSVASHSVSVQTEEIRVDKRLALLPKHLQPSSISSCPPSPEPTPHVADYFTPIPNGVPPRNPRRVKSKQSIVDIPSSPPMPTREPPSPSNGVDTYDAYPGNNDDGPLSSDKSSIRRPHRISSLFAGFENVSSDEADDFADGDLSDSDFRTALSAPRPKKSIGKMGKRTSLPPTSVPEDEEPEEEVQLLHGKAPIRQPGNYDANGNFTLRESPAFTTIPKSSMKPTRQFDKPLSLIMPSSKQPTMRRAALISNGIAAHQGRSRSPSLPEAVREPPFPIPTRASSRKPPFSVSAPSDGNRSPTRDWSSRRGAARGHSRINSIRKVRSAAALPDNGPRTRRRQSRSPPPFSPSTEAPESPQLPPMPNNEITSPFLPGRESQASSRYGGHRKQPSAQTANTFNTAQTGSSVQATSVVDAIAQTMVGEWMFKYVRRRKSFGVPDPGAHDGDAANGVRHKRWVWLAPYERAVMWSSKQPTSGSALMGKSGRKCKFICILVLTAVTDIFIVTIQSVLDVKDDNPPPKGVANLFNRSILILTPARALKFTATTRERHYIWLTALSFLAHSSQVVPEVLAPHPPPPETIPDFDISRSNGAHLRKAPIRDSIRVAKGRGPLGSHSVPGSVQSSIRGGGEYSLRTDTSTRAGGSAAGDHSVKDVGLNGGFDGLIPEAADPPVVPRFTDRAFPSAGHGRKRSNTGSRIPPPLSFRGFSERGPVSTGTGGNSMGTSGGPAPAGGAPNFSHYGHAPASSTAGMSVGTNGSSDIYNGSQRSSSVMGGNSISFTNGMSNSGRSSLRTSDASARPGAVVNNFFEAVGTVRMEAFISPMAFSRIDDYPIEADEISYNGSSISRGGSSRRRSKERRRRSRNRDSWYGRYRAPQVDYDDWYGGSKTAGEEEYRRDRVDDPFRGF